MTINSKLQKIFLQVGISVALLTYVLYRTGVRNIFESFANIRIVYIIPVFVFGFIIFFLSAVNFHRLCRTKCQIPFRHFVKFFYITRVLGEYTPGRIGDFSIVAYMKAHDMPASYAIFFTLVDKGMNTFSWGSFLLVSSVLFFDTLKQEGFSLHIPSYGFLVALVFCVCVIVTSLIFRRKIVRILPKVIHFFRQYFHVLVLNFFFTVIKLLASFASIYCIFLAFSITPSVTYIVFAQSLFSIANILPITIGGLGVREFVYTSIFPLAGISAGIAVSAALLSPVISGISKIVVLAGYATSPLLRAITKK